MAIEILRSNAQQQKKVWVVLDLEWIARQCGVQPTGEMRLVLGKLHLEAIIADVPQTAMIPAGSLVMVTGQNVFIPQGIALLPESP